MTTRKENFIAIIALLCAHVAMYFLGVHHAFLNIIF